MITGKTRQPAPSGDRFQAAVEMIDDAEALVRAAEEVLAATSDPTLADVAETELQSTLKLQDEILQAVAPRIEQRDRELTEAAWEVIRSAAGHAAASWSAKHRRWHSPALKARIVKKFGAAVYARLPW